jgi:transcription elongation GreA/GreB family factor
LEHNEDSTATFSIPINESERNGYLLQGYDNGHLNKVLISTLLSKRIDRGYKNGLNIQATLSFLKVIKEDEIIALHFFENEIKKFKAHLTQNISNREQLHLQGYKVIYSNFTNLEYQILPIEIHEKINRLVYKSFTSSGKEIDNSNYQNEWRVIKANSISTENSTIQPNLFDKKIELNSKVKLKYLESNKEVTIQITEYQTNNNINGIQTINHKSPLAISIMNKENGDKVRIVNTENIVEIIEILN